LALKKISHAKADALLKQPQPKTRKKKKIERTHRVWFHNLPQIMGQCSNPDCIDPRNLSQVHVAEVDGHLMCRFCFVAGWKDDGDAD